MKQSIGYTLSLNIAIIFVVIIFAIIAMALSYYKAYKVSKVMTSIIEKHEGYNQEAEDELVNKLTSLGYNITAVNCPDDDRNSSNGITKNGCSLVTKGTNGTQHSEGDLGYCVYTCMEKNEYYRYKTVTNMMLNFPIINRISNIPVETNTVKMYDYDKINMYGRILNEKIIEIKGEQGYSKNKTGINDNYKDSFLYKGSYKNGDYDGIAYEFRVPYSGEYEFELSGGQGGTFYGQGKEVQGGYGSHFKAKIFLKKGEIYYIRLGGEGNCVTATSANSEITVPGGFNGGGAGQSQHGGAGGNLSSYAGCSGGGATHVATINGELSSLKNQTETILLVAAGGGGAGVTYKKDSTKEIVCNQPGGDGVSINTGLYKPIAKESTYNVLYMVSGVGYNAMYSLKNDTYTQFATLERGGYHLYKEIQVGYGFEKTDCARCTEGTFGQGGSCLNSTIYINGCTNVMGSNGNARISQTGTSGGGGGYYGGSGGPEGLQAGGGGSSYTSDRFYDIQSLDGEKISGNGTMIITLVRKARGW